MEMAIRQALNKAASFLKKKGVASPRLEAELLLAFLLKRDRTYFYAHGEEKMGAEEEAAYQKILERRAKGAPLAYITGKKEFMGLLFSVNEKVLIPRPETEHLVEAVLAWSRRVFEQRGKKETLHILDLGAGCGNISVSLAYFLPYARVTGVDLSKEAVLLAEKNARLLGVSDRVEFLCGNYWEPFSSGSFRFHVIVSNPPYIPRKELQFLPREVQNEPLLALDGGTDGLDAYRSIFKGIRQHIKSPWLVALETGKDQSREVIKLGAAAIVFKRAEIIKDYAGIDRVVIFTGD